MVIQGVIRPPPEIRAVADRTALYVSKNGRAFEAKILNSEKGRTPKFAFLHTTSPFHAYYEERIQFYERGGTDDDNNNEKGSGADEKEKDKRTESSQDASVGRKDGNVADNNIPVLLKLKKKPPKASVIDPIAKALLTQRSKIAQSRKEERNVEKKEEGEPEQQERPSSSRSSLAVPPPLHFAHIVTPASLTAAQMETIKLVAQFTALSGKGGSFLSQFTLREWNNPAFAFCQPRHGHFPYFSSLVDAYRRILDLWKPGPSSELLDDDLEAMTNMEQCLHMLAYRAEYERDLEERKAKKQHDLDGGEGAYIDWYDFVVVETIDFAVDEVVEMSMLPPPSNLIMPQEPARDTKTPNALPTGRNDQGMEESDDEDQDGEQIRVVPNYTPKVVAAKDANKLDMAIDPITGKSISVKDMPEHLRIQLLDPKWAEERKRFQEKQKETNLVSGEAVASNLERLTKARDDPFKTRKDGHLNQANETEASSRDRLLQQTATVGPSLPSFTVPVGMPSSHVSQAARLQEPPSKRPKVEMASHPSAAPPPPPPPSQALAAEPVPPNATLPSLEDTQTLPITGNFTALTSSSELLPEAVFASSLSKPEVRLQIRIPNDPSQIAWKFFGQIVPLTVSVMSTVKALKEEISQKHLNAMPANKIQLKNANKGAFLKDGLTLAALNIGPTATLEVVPRARGGRK